MAAKLGSDDVSFRLGSSTPAAVYLGSEQVWSAAATLYFDGAVDGDWAELGNWWLDSGHTVAAPSLPAAGDSVIATANISDNSGGAVTVVNLTFDDPDNTAIYLGITITVTGNAAFNGSSLNDNTVTGNATFNDSSNNSGTVTGNATFNDSSQNESTVTGTATFTGSACNNGTAGTFVPDPPPFCA
jgi:hypothetical protein